MTFLPDVYRTPECNYAKFKQGENNFRILGSAIVGFEYWNQQNKPVRSATPFVTTPPDIREDEEGKVSIKHFWMFPIWSYDNQKIQIMEVTQKGIQEAIKALVTNKKWGDPTGYDITVTKEGTGFDTTYQVVPNPHSPLDASIAAAWLAIKLNLPAVYEGGDPFMAPETAEDTSTPFDNVESKQAQERAEIAAQATASQEAKNIASG
jgi:hypothetical protein